MAKTQTKHHVNLVKPSGHFFRRFHFLIFFIVLVGCLAASVFYINYTFTNIPEDGYTSSITPGTIDQTSLGRIQSLHTSSEPAGTPDLPSGRINAFGE